MRWRTYSPQFRNIEVPLPPLTEQDRIVRFLGWKVSGINKLINIKKMEIAESRLIRQRKIDSALTHSFDERSSCSEWINRPLKYFVTSNDESLKSPMSDDYEFDYLDISRETILKWINLRDMPAHKVGRQWKFKVSDVDEWIRSGGAADKATFEDESKDE